MSTADVTNSAPDNSYEQLLRSSLRGFEAAREAAEVLAKGVGSPSNALAERVRQYEEELDKLDHDINDGVTAAISQGPAQRTRELLACLKFIIELERDRKSTRLNSSHPSISYAVFCLKKKKKR